MVADTGGRRDAAAALTSYAASTLEAFGAGSAALLVSRRGELLAEGYLRGEPEDPSQEVSADSLWPWWSVTKSATAALVARLARRGIFSLDSRLCEALPEFETHGEGRFDRRELRLRHLMSHSSGCAIEGRLEDGIHVDPDTDLELVRAVTAPGAEFLYSSLGMHILERFVEAATGEDFGLLMRREVLEPFGMRDTRYLFEEDFAREPGLRGRALACEKGVIVPSQRRQRAGLGLYGPARDLLAFGEAWLSRADVEGRPWCDGAMREAFWTKSATRPSDGSDYGLLWWLFDEIGGRVASGASFSVCALLPAEGLVAVVARNHYGPTRSPFDYRADKLRILKLAKAFR
jgi:CubicO group peptidase (beta-lactamase class C family)